MPYSQKNWIDGAPGGTLITAAELNRMEAGVAQAQEKASAAGVQTWNGTAWSTRPTGFLFVEAFSDGTAGSTRDVAATTPTGAVNGDRWWKAS